MHVSVCVCMTDLVSEGLGTDLTRAAGRGRFWASILSRSDVQGLAHKRLFFITSAAETYREGPFELLRKS